MKDAIPQAVQQALPPKGFSKSSLLASSSLKSEGSSRTAEDEIARLREEVADLRRQLLNERETSQEEKDGLSDRQESPWLKIAGTVALTFVLGKLVRRLRLGAAGAAAVPLITAEINRKVW
jgi:hypothetical protein